MSDFIDDITELASLQEEAIILKKSLDYRKHQEEGYPRNGELHINRRLINDRMPKLRGRSERIMDRLGLDYKDRHIVYNHISFV